MFSFGPGRVSCEPAPAQAARRTLIFPHYFFCSITFLWPRGRSGSRSRSRRRTRLLAVVVVVVVDFFLAILCMNAGVLMLQTFSLVAFLAFPFLCFTSFSVLSSFNLISFHSLPLPPLDWLTSVLTSAASSIYHEYEWIWIWIWIYILNIYPQPTATINTNTDVARPFGEPLMLTRTILKSTEPSHSHSHSNDASHESVTPNRRVRLN